MARQSTTADLIVEAARLRFNEKGYATTTLSEIAAAVGISQGNLTYHFPTKRDLVTRMQETVAARVQDRRATHQPGEVEDDYVDHLRFAMDLTATYRFLLRDDGEIEPGPDHQTPHEILVNHYGAIRTLIERVHQANLFRTDIEIDTDVLTRSLWVLNRYWMDYLSEMELQQEISPADRQRGIEHHLAVLLPNLVAAGRHRFDEAMRRATTHDECDRMPPQTS